LREAVEPPSHELGNGSLINAQELTGLGWSQTQILDGLANQIRESSLGQSLLRFRDRYGLGTILR
jgi:hypothetical protein